MNFKLNGKIEELPYERGDLFHKLRVWLIQKLVGNYSVILNVGCSVVDSDAEDVLFEVEGQEWLIDVGVDNPDGKIFKFTKRGG